MDNLSLFSRIWKFLKKPAVSLTLRIVISALLLIYLIHISALTEVIHAFNRINPLYLILFFVLYFLSIGIQSFRWKYLLRAWGVSLNAGILFRWLMTGLFLSNFLPSSLGGDAYRLYSGGRHTEKLEDIAATIFYERVFGYGSLLILGLFMLSTRFNLAQDWFLWFLLGGALLGLITLSSVTSIPLFEHQATILVERYAILRKFRLNEWLKSFRFKTHQPRTLAIVLALSFLIQFIDVMSFHIIATAIHLPVAFTDLLIFVPVLYLAILLPFSLNGIGIRESVFVMFSNAWGIHAADAVAFSLTVFTLNLAGSLVGGIIYWFDRPIINNPEQES